MLISILWFSAFIATATAVILQKPLVLFQRTWRYKKEQYILDSPLKPDSKKNAMVLPMYDSDHLKRFEDISRKQEGFLYGPSLLGNSSYFPTGFMGDNIVQKHQAQWYSDAYWLTCNVSNEIVSATAALEKVGGLRTPLDYQHLYHGQWKNSVPSGIAPGAFANYTSDLLFAMERLSVNPYPIKRLHPSLDNLSISLSDEIVYNLTGISLGDLHHQGRLFLVDHKSQAKYPITKGRYTAACSAYFYIHPRSGELLPLAIKTNVGANLVYTPLDEELDWLLAKAMFNVNDLFHSQIFHLINSHAVSEIGYLAALRTLGDNHPILVLLNRLMRQAYAIRPVGAAVLFNPGGFFEQSFAINVEGVHRFVADYYPEVAGPFRANYLHSDLTRRGILNCTYGPALKSIPFFEDANILQVSIQNFIISFVESYYTDDELLTSDYELQFWVREATENASVIDFPASPLVQRSTLIGILTHIAFLNSVSHSVLNSGQPVTSSGVLPLHPASLYQPIPVQKGVKDIMPFLPEAAKAIEHIALFARFNRPQLVAEKGTLNYMFSSREFLESGREKIKDAVRRFEKEMEMFSEIVQKRTFDNEGLSQGMPFIWKGLDPGQIPFFLSV